MPPRPASQVLPAAIATLLLDHVPTLVSYIDAERRYVAVNLAYEEWFGHPREEIVGRTLIEVLGPAAWEGLREHVERALAGETVRFDRHVPYSHGGHRHVDATYTPHFAPDGRVLGFIASVTDITGRVVEHTAAIRASGERTQRILDITPDLVCTVEPHGTRASSATSDGALRRTCEPRWKASFSSHLRPTLSRETDSLLPSAPPPARHRGSRCSTAANPCPRPPP